MPVFFIVIIVLAVVFCVKFREKLNKDAIVRALLKRKKNENAVPPMNEGESVLGKQIFEENSVQKPDAPALTPIVALVTFDNKDELLKDTDVQKRSKIVAKVENQLQKWAMEADGVMRRLHDGRYFVVFDEQFLQQIIQKKFEILEKIRKIGLDEKNYATISIGLGRGASSILESETWAAKALEMALGRGGDQAVVKNADGFVFFGGISGGSHTSNKVRTRVIASAILNLIDDCDNVLLMGHNHSDLDCVGACVGLWSAITKTQKKTARVVLNRETTLAKALVRNVEESAAEEIFVEIDQAEKFLGEKTVFIVVDTHVAYFLESPEIFKRTKRTVVIDHHRLAVDHIENAQIFYHEPTASSACEMVTELIQYFGENFLTASEAGALLSGIMLDTKNFVMKTGVRTFEAAAFLRKSGADTVVVKRLFASSADTYREKYFLISNTEIIGKLAVCTTEKDLPNMHIAAAQAADELLGIEGVDASFVIFPEGSATTICARSMGEVNVQLIMEELGGGGHQTMAAAKVSNGDALALKNRIIQAVGALG